MGEYLQTIVLALVQGLTEFLPISSTGHLILIGNLPGWSDQGLAFDVAVHLGTLVAVIWYFKSELFKIGSGFTRSVVYRKINDESRLFLKVTLATIPVVLAGYILQSWFGTQLRSIELIAFTTIGFGLLLWFADWNGKDRRPVDNHTHPDFSLSSIQALLIGIAQVFALIPGTSRSGVTITAALLLGLSRVEAARFSFLLAIPVILASTILLLYQSTVHSSSLDWTKIFIGTFIAGVTAFVCIQFFIRLVEKIGMLPFVIYRLLLGGIIVIFIWA